MPPYRLRLRFEELWQFRAHAQPRDDDAVMHWPRPPRFTAPMPCELEIELTGARQFVPLRGVITPAADGSAAVRLDGAAALFDETAAPWQRRDRRLPTDVPIVVQGLQLTIREVSLGGARIDGASAPVGRIVTVDAPARLEARVIWTEPAAMGVRWEKSNLSTRAAARRLFESALREWQHAPLLAHPNACTCARRMLGPLAEGLLLAQVS